MTTLSDLNAGDQASFVAHLLAIYEHSPWIPQRAAAQRPFASEMALRLALQAVVRSATPDEQLGLIRAHPQLAGKAAIAGQLMGESAQEQAKSGLNHCSAGEFAALQRLNGDYSAKFGFPFILAVRGPDGAGLTRQSIIATFARRLKQQPADEISECLRQIHRIAELRLNDLLGSTFEFGPAIMQRSEFLAAWSDTRDDLTCAYMTAAHRKTAAQLANWMHEAGMTVHVDAVGNVVGRYLSALPGAKTLMTGSHYDTVRDAGKYDGRLGILLPIAVVSHLHGRHEKLPFHVEIIAFADEEGVRFKSTFLGSHALSGHFDLSFLEHTDDAGITMREALTAAGHDIAAIGASARKREDLLGFVEVHIEQGPVLLERDLALGVVTSIAGSSRFLVELTGLASHAGTTPMTMRKDAAAAGAEIVLMLEHRCASRGDSLVGTVGQLQVPNGSVNVIPGACKLSLDIRAADDAVRLAAVADVLDAIAAICARRHIDFSIQPVVATGATACAPWLMQQLIRALDRCGLPRFELASGAGHDAMAMATITDVAMLFTRCGNGGISHNRLETVTTDDVDLAARVLLDFLRQFRPHTA